MKLSKEVKEKINNWFSKKTKKEIEYIFNKHASKNCYVYIITFYDYDNDIIKHIFNDELTAIKKHKELQKNRSYGYYHLHKKQIE